MVCTKNSEGSKGVFGIDRILLKFVKDYGKIAQPLTSLCKATGPFKWIGEADIAFQRLKLTMVEALVLALPDFAQNFIVETDASGIGIKAVLMQ